MKKSKKNLPATVAPAEPEVVEAPTALTVRACEIVFPDGVETLGEKANYLHAYSVESAKRSAGAAILAGWVLSVARSTCAHGQWMQWLEQNVSFSHQTASNYLSLYAQTLGAKRAAMRRPIALDVQPTEEELEAAAHDVDGKALSALYKSTRLMATNGEWGGKRKDAGRKAKDADVAAELKAVAKMEPVLWASAKGALDALWKLDSEKDFMRRLSDDHLAQVSNILTDLSEKAAKALAQRLSSNSTPSTLLHGKNK